MTMDSDHLRQRSARFATSQPQRSAVIPDQGRILARSPRNDGTEFRVSLHVYNEHPFVRVGPWQSGAPDAFPCKGKVAAVRVSELGTLAEGIALAMDAIERERGR